MIALDAEAEDDLKGPTATAANPFLRKRQTKRRMADFSKTFTHCSKCGGRKGYIMDGVWKAGRGVILGYHHTVVMALQFAKASYYLSSDVEMAGALWTALITTVS